MKKVRITYHGHACFTLEAEGYRTVLDPYEDGMLEGAPKLQLEAEAVYCSHQHGDHNYVQAVKLCNAAQKIPYTVTSFETPHDDKDGTLRGMNQVRIFDFGGVKVAHLGDIGIVPEGAVLDALKGVDCLLIPVGGVFTIDPAAAAETIALVNPKVAIPMHYRTDSIGLGILAHLKDFTDRFEQVNSCDICFELTEETEKQILVINFIP